MSLFHEEDLPLPQLFVNNVNQGQHQQTDFRFVRLISHDTRSNRVNLESDFFNHITFNETRGSLLRTIQAPQISQTNRVLPQEVIDLESESVPQNQQSSQAPQKQKLLQQTPQAQFKPVKLDWKEFKNQKYAQPEEVVKDFSNISSFITTLKSIDSDEVLKSLDIYSRRNIRQTLQDSLNKAKQITDVEERFQKMKMFTSLNQCVKESNESSQQQIEGKLFGDEKSLEFAQLNSILPYVNKSNLTRDLFPAILVNNKARINQMAEYIIFNLVINQEAEANYPLLFTLQLDQKHLEIELGEGLDSVKGLDKTKIFVDLKSEIEECKHLKNELLDKNQMQKITELVDEDTDKFGVMLYFGGLNDTLAEERKYRTQFLQHIILALKTLQVKGSLVLELKETFTNFSASLIFILSKLFESILLTKPYNSSPLSTTQFLVCTDLLKARPAQVISKLQELLDSFIQNSQKFERLTFEFGDLVDQKILMSQERFLNYIRGANEAISIYRHQYLQLIIENVQVPERYAQDMKNDLLRKWGLLIGDPSINQANRRSGTLGGVEDILERKLDVSQMNNNPRSTQAYNPRATGKYGQGTSYGGASIYGGGRPSGSQQKDGAAPVFQEPLKKPTEQELQQMRRKQEREEKDLLNSIIGTKEIERKKEEEMRKRKELREQRELKEKEEKEQLERQKQALLEKLQKNQGGKKKEKPKEKDQNGAQNIGESAASDLVGSKGRDDHESKKREAKAAQKEELSAVKSQKQSDKGSQPGGNMIRIPAQSSSKPSGDERVGQKRKATRPPEEEQERVYQGESDFAIPLESVQASSDMKSSRQKMQVDEIGGNQKAKINFQNEEDLRSKEEELKRKLEEQKRKQQEENKQKMLQNPAVLALLRKNQEKK